MRKFIFVLFGSVILIACTPDSSESPIDTNTNVNPKTFLEIVNGKSFQYSRGDWDDIFFFSNSKTFLYNSAINRLTKEKDNCYSFTEGVNAKILSNSENGLLIEIKWSESSQNWNKYEFSLNDTGNFLIYREDFGDPDDVEWYLISDRRVTEFCSN